jgi:membrane-bound serine protease (ClpP class)
VLGDIFFILSIFILGFILLLIELFITPGFGIIGLAGLGLLAYGSWISYVKFNIWVGLAVALGSIIVVVLIFKFFPRTGAWKKLNLSKTFDSKSGYKASSEELELLLGKEGRTLSCLRPSGVAEIEGKRIDVQTEGIFMEKDTDIVVVRIEGTTAIVKQSNEKNKAA